MYWVRFVLISAVFAVAEAARNRRSSISSGSDEDDSGENEGSDAEWEDIACHAYDRCLNAYDEKISSCSHSKDKEPDDGDSCYEPIRKQFTLLVSKKEKKSQLLRLCYLTGRVDGERRDKSEKSIAVGKRHRSSCRHRFGELEQFLVPKKTNGKDAKGAPLKPESCHSISKRIKERCQKIESCCPRIKTCRARINQHNLMDQMRDIEQMIKDERRKCMEHHPRGFLFFSTRRIVKAVPVRGDAATRKQHPKQRVLKIRDRIFS